jgi:plasmid stabilization system protein ParE
MGYKLNPYAESDLEEIFYYGFKTWGEEQAIIFIQTFYQRFEWLSEHPEIAPIREDFSPTIYRTWLESPYVIFYRIIGKDIEIMIIVHGKKNFLTDEFQQRLKG